MSGFGFGTGCDTKVGVIGAAGGERVAQPREALECRVVGAGGLADVPLKRFSIGVVSLGS